MGQGGSVKFLDGQDSIAIRWRLWVTPSLPYSLKDKDQVVPVHALEV
jgi:hypothetical protein